MRNNKRQFVGGLVLAAMMATAMPLSADTVPGPGGPDSSICGFVSGVLIRANAPEAIGKILLGIFGCA
jgi:hypothetical protein